VHEASNQTTKLFTINHRHYSAHNLSENALIADCSADLILTKKKCGKQKNQVFIGNNCSYHATQQYIHAFI
jgi:hypothetical protein